VEVTTEVTARALPARYLPLTFGAVFATALTFTALRLLGIRRTARPALWASGTSRCSG
jgi:hypothetical protein